MESVLRPYDLGATQWYVLNRLAEAPTMQRDLVRLLKVERATLSVIVSALARRGLLERVQDTVDQRQRLLRLTPAGVKLWHDLPDLSFIRLLAFKDIDEAELSVAIDVLRTATERLNNLTKQESEA
jgi:DNA-binding MarR family transcriptional regulator